jgi:hypothetical protein
LDIIGPRPYIEIVQRTNTAATKGTRMMRNTEFALQESGALGLLALLTTHGILRSALRAPEANVVAKTKSPGWFDRFDTWLWRQELRSFEAYLAQSDDIFDLERRQRALERGRR